MNEPYTYIFSLLNLPPISFPIPPLQVDTEPLFEFPEPHSKFPLAIYFTYGNVCFHVTLSYNLPSPPPPHVRMSVLCLFLHCCPTNKILRTIFLDSIYMCQNMVFIFLFLTHFTLYNRFQVSTSLELTEMYSFLWLSNNLLCICTTTSLSIHPSMDLQVASMFQLL